MGSIILLVAYLKEIKGEVITNAQKKEVFGE
jgi:hypothetical protein